MKYTYNFHVAIYHTVAEYCDLLSNVCVRERERATSATLPPLLQSLCSRTSMPSLVFPCYIDDDTKPACRNKYYTITIPIVLVDKVMQDLFHQQYFVAQGSYNQATAVLKTHL